MKNAPAAADGDEAAGRGVFRSGVVVASGMADGRGSADAVRWGGGCSRTDSGAEAAPEFVVVAVAPSNSIESTSSM